MFDSVRLRNQIQGSSDLLGLFGAMFSAAATSLSAVDLEQLEAARPGSSPTATGWVTSDWWESVLLHLEALSARPPGTRYRLRQPERAKLLSLAGEDALKDPRTVLMLALAVDRALRCFRDDFPARSSEWFPFPGVVPVPRALLSDTTTLPPSLGQMTPIAVCRRWLQNLWFVGRVDAFRGFGELPVPRGIRIPARTENALREADDAGMLRVGFVQWPTHNSTDLQTNRHGGCFAVTGYSSEDVPSLLAAVRAADELKVHVLIGPEMALTPDSLGELRKAAASERRRHPVLSVWGLVHAKRSDSAYENCAVVLDSKGSQLFSHEKLEAYTDKELGLEHIIPRSNREYRFMDTPIGRFGVNICRDFRSDVPMLLNRALGLTFLAVPAYSGELSFIAEEAPLLGARQNAIIASCNAANLALKDRAYMYAPIRGRNVCSVRWAVNGTPDSPVLVVDLCRSAGAASLSSQPSGT